MRIIYDGQIFGSQSVGGVNRYFANIIGRLPGEFAPILTTAAEPDLQFPVHSNLEVVKYTQTGLRPRPVFSRIEKVYNEIVSCSLKYDIAHPTNYWLQTCRGIPSYRCPVVVTVYDMIHELFMDKLHHKSQRAVPERKREAIASAQAIICISESTKQDLLKFYPEAEKKVSVTYLASDLNVDQSWGQEKVPERPFFLYVGGRYGYKNFDGLIRALADVVSTQKDVSLCVVGRPLFGEEETLVRDLGISEHVECYGNVNDTHLAKLYRTSLAFVYPTLYEGFGIPPLEAMACGAVAIASNVSSLPEVVGDGGLLFDPASPSELSDIMMAVVNREVDRDAITARGLRKAAQFSWDKTTAQTVKVYRSLLN